MALCSLNLAEASTSMMSRDVLAQIYATAAVTVMHTLVDNLHFIAVSYMTYINNSRSISMNDSLTWPLIVYEVLSCSCKTHIQTHPLSCCSGSDMAAVLH